MFISKVHLFNWLSHADTTLDLDGISGIRGENGSGKTSVQSGLEFAFTGRAVQTDDRGGGAKDLIRRGTDKSAVTIDFTDEGRPIRLRCSLTEKSGRTVQLKDPSDPSWTGSEYLLRLAAKREILDCLLNGRYFAEMSDAGQKTLLAAMVLPEKYEFEEWTKGHLKDCGLTVDPALRAIDYILAAYDKSFKERTAISRMVKEHPEPTAPEANAGDPDAIRVKLSERQTQRTDLYDKIQGIRRDAQQHSRDLETAQQAIIKLQQRLSADLERKKGVNKDLLSKAELKQKEETAAKAAKALDVDTKIIENGKLVAIADDKLKTFVAAAEEGKCPCCFQPIDDAVLQSVGEPLTEHKNKLLHADHALQEERKALGDPAGAQRAIDAHRQATTNVELVEKHIEEAEREIQEAKAKIEALSAVKATDTAEMEGQLKDLDDRIVKGTTALTAAIQAMTAKQAYEKAVEARTKLLKKQEQLEKLVEYFGAKGVQAKLLGESIGGFQEKMNGFLKGWGFECQLSFEPFEFRVGLLSSGETFLLRTMSDGQRAMFGAAFQVALAKMSGFDFVCIDATEVFSEDNRIALFKNLAGSGIKQAIVISAEVRRKITKRAGCAYYLFTLDRSGAVPTTKVERLKYEQEDANGSAAN